MLKITPLKVVALIVLLIAAVAAILTLQKSPAESNNTASAKTSNTENAPTTKPALTVNAVKPQAASLPMVIAANGNIAAWQEAVIGAEVNGLLLKEVLVNVGDTVKKGQVIARFNTSNIDADIAQAKANLAEAKANAIEAINNADRARSIQNSGALSALQVTQYLSAEASTKARVDAAEAALKVQQVKLGQTTVLASDSGIISARSATVGAVASAGQELFKLIRQGRLEWRAELTSADVGKIKTGMVAHLSLPDGNTLQGKVRSFAPNVDSQTRNAIVYVDLPANTAKAGMYARGEFTLSDSNAYVLPASAVVMREGFAYVMKIEPNLHITQLKVALGRRQGEMVEVLDLADTEANYVASGGAFLIDGDIVKVVPDAQVSPSTKTE